MELDLFTIDLDRGHFEGVLFLLKRSCLDTFLCSGLEKSSELPSNLKCNVRIFATKCSDLEANKKAHLCQARKFGHFASEIHKLNTKNACNNYLMIIFYK